MIEIYVKDMRFPLLLDAYGVLLTERKRELLLGRDESQRGKASAEQK